MNDFKKDIADLKAVADQLLLQVSIVKHQLNFQMMIKQTLENLDK